MTAGDAVNPSAAAVVAAACTRIISGLIWRLWRRYGTVAGS